MANYREYRIKGVGERYLKITNETPNGFSVIITTIESGWKEEKKEFMSRTLFETCLRTDYLTPKRAGQTEPEPGAPNLVRAGF